MVNLQVDLSKKGIWKYYRYFPPIEERYWLTLTEGETPTLTANGIIFKREDLNPTGSLKDRGLAYQVSQAYAAREKNLVISSSGNAAISAAAYCQQVLINLFVFVPKNIPSGKLEKIKKYGGKITFSERPVSDSLKFSRQKGYMNLRPSTDLIGPEGYKTIAFELFRQLGRIEDIFIPVSSATSLVGVAEGFKILGFIPHIHACQSTRIFPIAAEFDKDFKKTETSLAQALVARITQRKKIAIEIVKKSGGWGWVISDGELKEAWNWLENNRIGTSAEGALTLAAIWKAKSKNFKIGKTVCLLSGKKY